MLNLVQHFVSNAKGNALGLQYNELVSHILLGVLSYFAALKK